MPRMKAERTAVDTEKVRSRIQTDIGRHVGQARNIAYRSFLQVLCEPPLDTIAPRQIALVPLEDVDLGCPPEPRIPTNDAAVLIKEPNELAAHAGRLGICSYLPGMRMSRMMRCSKLRRRSARSSRRNRPRPGGCPPSQFQGLRSGTPVASKSATFRVITVIP